MEKQFKSISTKRNLLIRKPVMMRKLLIENSNYCGYGIVNWGLCKLNSGEGNLLSLPLM